MTTINMKRDGQTFVPESIDLDPYSEYQHPSPGGDGALPQNEPQAPQPVQIIQKPRQDAVGDKIDNFFDGVDMVFNIINHVERRFNGGQNVRRGKSNK